MSSIPKKIQSYSIKKLIGNGTYGTVYLAEKNNNIFVLKQIPFGPQSDKDQIISIKNEAKILSSLHSKYIVKYYESFELNNTLNIIMEYCEGGDLGTYLVNDKKKSLSEDQIWKLFIQICLGIYILHKQKILHRDLKTLNIFLTSNFDVKIGDLGVAKVLQNTNFANTFIGTPYYISPEICEEKPYNEKSDIWALGCILYEMITLKHPFEANNQAALLLKILTGKYEPLPIKVSNDFKQMVKILLEKNCYKRPNINELFGHTIIVDRVKKCNMIDEVGDVIGVDKMKLFHQMSTAKKKINISTNNKKIKIKKIKLPIAKPNQVDFKGIQAYPLDKKINVQISTEKKIKLISKINLIGNAKKSSSNLSNSPSNQIIKNIPKNSSQKEVTSEKQTEKKNKIHSSNPNTNSNNNPNTKENANSITKDNSNSNSKDNSNSNTKDNSNSNSKNNSNSNTKDNANSNSKDNANSNSNTKDNANSSSKTKDNANSNPNNVSKPQSQSTEEKIDLNQFMSLLSKKADKQRINLSNILNSTDNEQGLSNSNKKVNKNDDQESKEKTSVFSSEDELGFNTPIKEGEQNETDDLEQVGKKIKEKYEECLKEIKSYSDMINIDKIFDMYRTIEQEEGNEDAIVFCIEEYIKKTIPSQAKKFINSFYNLIFTRQRYNNMCENAEED